MSMIVARMQKMKAENLIGIGNHNQRKTKNHSNPDIDTSPVSYTHLEEHYLLFCGILDHFL